MLTEVPDPAEPNWLLRAVGMLLLVGLVVLGALLTGGGGFLDSLATDNSVAVTNSYHDDGNLVQLQLASKPSNVSTVYVETDLGTRIEMRSVGDTHRFVAVNNSTLTVYAVRNGEEQRAQRVPINRGYDPTTVVARDANGDYARIQPAVDAADPGDVILVKQGTYRGSIVLDKPVTLVGEVGTRLVPDDCDEGGIKQKQADATVRYIQTVTRCR